MFESLLEKIKRVDEADSRFSPMVGENREAASRSVKGYLSGSTSVLAEAEEGEYTVVILDDFRELYFHRSLPKKPVPAGDWMDWWEEDHEKYFGVTKSEYGGLPTKERAELEAKLQLKLWVGKEFWNLFAEFYYEEQYDKWFWDEGGKELRGLDHGNDYWKIRLRKM